MKKKIIDLKKDDVFLHEGDEHKVKRHYGGDLLPLVAINKDDQESYFHFPGDEVKLGMINN